MRPASFVAWRCASLKYAGTVMTALRDRSPEKALGVALELAQNESRNFRRSERLVAELDAQNFARLQVFGQAEWEEFQFFLNVVNPASHEAFD